MNVTGVSDALMARIKSNLFNVVIIVSVLLIALKGFQNNALKLKQLAEDNQVEAKKNLELQTYLKLDRKMKALTTQINNKAIARIINNLSGYAKEAGVKIVFIKPDNPKVFPVHTRYNYDLTVAAEKSHAIGRFIGLLENSRDLYFVDELSLTVNFQQLEKDKASARLKIGTILVN